MGGEFWLGFLVGAVVLMAPGALLFYVACRDAPVEEDEHAQLGCG